MRASLNEMLEELVKNQIVSLPSWIRGSTLDSMQPFVASWYGFVAEELFQIFSCEA